MGSFRSRRVVAGAVIAAAASMLGLALTAVPAQAAHGDWTCRATGVRIGDTEIGTANAPNDPCRTQTGFPVNLPVPLGELGGIHALGVGGSTDATRAGSGFGNGISAQAGALGVSIFLLGQFIQTGEVRNIAFANCGRRQGTTQLTPRFRGPHKNQVAGVILNDDGEINVDGPFVLDELEALLTVKLAQTVIQTTATGKQRRQRTLEINSPLLPTIVIGEAIVGWDRNPCRH